MATRSFARSLYWRIGLGLILFLAITLVAQVGLFLWVAGATEGGMPARMGRDFAELVASEFEAALLLDPNLDLHAYARRRVNELHRPAAIIFPDGTAVAPPGTDIPRGMRFPPPFRRRGGRQLDGSPRQADGPPPRSRYPFGGSRRGPVMATIEHENQVVAVVWVPPLTGLSRVAAELGTPLVIGAILLLIGGTVVSAIRALARSR